MVERWEPHASVYSRHLWKFYQKKNISPRLPSTNTRQLTDVDRTQLPLVASRMCLHGDIAVALLGFSAPETKAVQCALSPKVVTWV